MNKSDWLDVLNEIHGGISDYDIIAIIISVISLIITILSLLMQRSKILLICKLYILKKYLKIIL